ncbi:MAG TPA: hypothetical protein V6D25_00380 [Leptolyngbyaceae cyanobacterium]
MNNQSVEEKSNVIPVLVEKGEIDDLEVFSPMTISEIPGSYETGRTAHLLLPLVYPLLQVGGWTVSVLITFRLVMIPLLTAGSTPVTLTLAIGVSTFLVLCGICAVIKVLERSKGGK